MEEKNNNEKYWNAEKSNGFDSKQNWFLHAIRCYSFIVQWQVKSIFF